MYVEWHFLPICRLIFANRPSIRSVTLAFAMVDDRPTQVEDRLLVSEQWDPAWPADEEALEEGSDLVESAENELFAGSDWPALWDYDLVVAFGSFCVDVDRPRLSSPVFSRYAIARPGKNGVEVQYTGELRNPFWEDNFNVGRRRFRATLASFRSPGPLRGVPPEAVNGTSNAYFSYTYSRTLAKELLRMARLDALDPTEMARIREWVRETRDWQRGLRTHR